MPGNRDGLPPGPRGAPVLGSLRPFRRDMLGFLLETAREYGDIAHFTLGRRPFCLLVHPDDIKSVLVTNNRNFVKGRGLQRTKRLLGEGLLTSEGELHRRQRRLVQPAFHHERITAYGEIMSTCAEHAQRAWEDGRTIDVANHMMHLTLQIVAKALFATDAESDAKAVSSAMADIVEWFWSFTLPFSWLRDRLPLPTTLRFRRARAQVDATVRRMIDERRADGTDRGDLISMLLLARDTEGNGTAMSDEQVRDEALTILLAGHETTANALIWTWYLLSQHPEMEARLHEEADTLPASRLPSAADLEALRFTRAVLAEAMRLYPPVWVVARRAVGPFSIGPYVLPKNTTVLMSPYVTQRDCRFFADPELFDPDRWACAGTGQPRFSYFPFGGGARQCAGEHFGWMEGILVLATIARRWRLRLPAGHVIHPHPTMTLRPSGSVPMRLERRR